MKPKQFQYDRNIDKEQLGNIYLGMKMRKTVMFIDTFNKIPDEV